MSSCFSLWRRPPLADCALSPGSADQISNELSDLIGTDFDRSFVDWLFDQVKVHYPEPASASASASAASSSAPSSTPAPAPTSAPASASASASQPRNASAGGPASDRNNGIPSRPTAPLVGGGGGGGGRQVFGAAVSGMKRGARERDNEDGGSGSAGGERQPQRARYDGPAGGGGPRGNNGNSGRSLFDRVNGNNPQFAPGRTVGPVNNTGMPQPAFDAVSLVPAVRRKRDLVTGNTDCERHTT